MRRLILDVRTERRIQRRGIGLSLRQAITASIRNGPERLSA